MKRKTRKFQEGGFTKEQEEYLGGADRTDPYILARMRKAVPDKPMAKPSVDTGELRDETGEVSKIRKSSETGDLYSTEMSSPVLKPKTKTVKPQKKKPVDSMDFLDTAFDETGKKSDINQLRELKRESTRGIRSKANREADLERQRESTRGIRTMKKGGSVSSASKRADGCAIRGKTKA